MISVAGNILVILLALALADTARRAGNGLLPLVSLRRFSGLEKIGLGFLLGWGAFGTALLGLALTGLFSFIPMALAALLSLVAARGIGIRDPTVKSGWRQVRALGWAGPIVCGTALLAILHRLLTPATDSTAFLYHLSIPWNFLLKHRALVSQVSWSFHLPVLVDIGFAPALLFGDDRIAKWQAFLYLLAAGAFYAGMCLRRDRPAAAWTGPLWALAISYMIGYAGCTKNDIPASAFFVVGALLTLDRARTLGGLFLGLSLAAKFTYAPMILIWVVFSVLSHRRLVWAILLVFLPVLPWCAKSQLIMGNPLHPLTGLLFGSFEWGYRNQAAAGDVLGGIWQGGFYLADIPSTLFRDMSRHYFFTLLLVPGALFLGSRRRAAGACLLAMAVNLAVRHEVRYVLPAAWLLVLFAAWVAEEIPSPFKIAARLVGTAYAATAIILMSGALEFDYSGLLRSREDFFRREQPVRQKALAMLDRSRAERVLVVGDWRTYGLKARPVYNGYEGETPLIWKAVNESRDFRDLGRKFRQLGVSHIYYNHVTAVLISGNYAAFPWDRRMIRLYVEYCKRFQRIVGYTDRCDHSCGGIYLYEIAQFPRAPALESLWFAPGMESIYSGGLDMLVKGENEKALARFRKCLEIVPDVGQAWNNLGMALYYLGDFAGALEALEKFHREGMMDEFNMAFYGVALTAQGRYEEGEKVLLAARDRYPHRTGIILKALADIQMRKAMVASREGDSARTLEAAERGLEYLGGISPDDRDFPKDGVLGASLTAAIGKSLLMRGELAMAGCKFLEASRMAPKYEQAANWLDIARNLPPCPESLSGD